MKKIQLASVWYLDESKPLGPSGGFGQVFEGSDSAGTAVAIKLFHADQASNAGRELDVAAVLSKTLNTYVIPVLEAGFDRASGRPVIVMAKARRSLERYIADSAPIDEAEVLELLNAISSGIKELGKLVHRDLKPANVLEHENTWKLADLGLARFLDSSTTAHTMRDFLSAPYAAPELWNSERPTKAVDLYSIGCITYALRTGRPPFVAHDSAEYKRLHESMAPPPLPASPRLAALTASCLSKRPELRPSIDSYRERLATIGANNLASGPSKLAHAAFTIARRRSLEEATAVQAKQGNEQRSAIASEAAEKVKLILSNLMARVRTEAPDAKDAPRESWHWHSPQLGMAIELGDGILCGDIDFLPSRWGNLARHGTSLLLPILKFALAGGHIPRVVPPT
jgi:eukaryotic-like serine/threonine-protein kinase